MQEETITADLRKKALSYGVILGLISFILGVISLFIVQGGTSFYTALFLGTGLNLVVFIALACFFSTQLRKSIGGYWDFSTALKNIFIMLAISAVLSTVATSLLNAFYPQLQEAALTQTINNYIETMEDLGVPDEQIDTQVAAFEEELASLGTLSVGQIVKGIGISLILYFVLSLILAAIFKKEKPIFIRPTEESAHPWQDNPPA